MSENKPSRLTKLREFIRNHRWLLAILFVAVFFRFWQLNSLPPGLHPDEAANGLDIFRIFSGDLRVLYDTNGPRESLFFFLQAPFVWLLDNTILALRITPAAIGVLSVGVTYLWAKEWFDKKIALYTGFFYAVGVWAVTLSRDGYRANMVPLVVALNAWLTTKMLLTRKWYWAVLTGASYAAGLYTYFSYRLILLALIAVSAAGLIKYKGQLKGLLKPLGIMVASGAIALIPLGLYAVDHPADVISGRSSVAFTNPELNNGEPLKTLGDTIVKTALMFNFKGDPNFRHNLGGAPMLEAATGIFFVLGFLVALRRIKDIRYFGLLAVFGAMMLPEIVTAEGIPHGLRAIGALPVVYMLAGVGLMELTGRYKGVFPRNPLAKSALSVIMALVLLSTAAYSYQRYFVAWANSPETYEAYSEDAVSAAEYLNQNQFEGQRYVVIGGYSNQTIAYLTHNKSSYIWVEPNDISSQLQINGPAQIIVLASEDEKFRASAGINYQNLKHTDVKSTARTNVSLFSIYETPN